jgi:DNA helicase-2/ATP-dependent DNA helicase PcrA
MNLSIEQLTAACKDLPRSMEQRLAINSQSPTICMMAGPGSGKTHTLGERTKELVARGVEPSQMIVITFTNEAANELQKRSDLDFGYRGTLHGYLLRIIQEFGSRIGLSGPLAVITEAMQKELIDEVRKETGNKSGTKKDLQAALDLGPHRLQELFASGRALTKHETTALAYYQRIIAESMVDYDSILHLGYATLLKLDPYDLKAMYLFVDEYQDSSPLDAAIYAAMPVTDRFFIGDPDQAIYGFRGADVGNIVRLTEADGVEVLALEDNYRCDSEIAAAAQRLIEHNADRPQKTTRSVTGGKGKVLLHQPFDYYIDELIWVAQQINQLPDPCEVAVLVRRRKEVDFFRDGLRGHGVRIPVERYPQKQEGYQQSMLLLSLLCNPDNDTLASTWIKETQGKSAANKAKSGAADSFQSINRFTLHLPTSPKLDEAMSLLRKHGLSAEMSNFIRDIADKLPNQYSLSELVSSLSHALRFEPQNERHSGVTVSTIHAAKGTEYDHVFLPAFEDGIIPKRTKTATLEEERRVGLVAITRARHSVTVTCSLVREDPYTGREAVAHPSQFIKELLPTTLKETICQQ